MKVLYTTGEAMYLAEGGKSIELPSYRAQQYQATIEQITNNKAWKTTGRGAQFMGVAEMFHNDPFYYAMFILLSRSEQLAQGAHLQPRISAVKRLQRDLKKK